MECVFFFVEKPHTTATAYAHLLGVLEVLDGLQLQDTLEIGHVVVGKRHELAARGNEALLDRKRTRLHADHGQVSWAAPNKIRKKNPHPQLHAWS
jgi:hypothetical protein